MDIISEARKLGEKIQKTEQYQKLVRAKRANDNDETLTELVGEFNLLKMQLQSAMAKETPDQQEIDQKNKRLRELYEQIMDNENMQAFNAASDQANQMMQQITTILSTAINGGDPLTCPTEQTACSGDCSSCGGC